MWHVHLHLHLASACGICMCHVHVIFIIGLKCDSALRLQGTLECDPDATAALALRAKFILVQAGGRFLCGSADSPFGQNGATLSIELFPDFVKKVMQSLARRILVYGELVLHGRQYTSWRRLEATALAGTSELRVQGMVDWQHERTDSERTDSERTDSDAWARVRAAHGSLGRGDVV